MDHNLDHLDPETATVTKGGREVTLLEAYLLGEDPGDPNDVMQIGNGSTGLRSQSTESPGLRMDISKTFWNP